MAKKKKKLQRRENLAKTAAAPPRHPPAEPILARDQFAILLGLLALLAIVPYVNAFSNDFVLDDVPIIVENPLIQDMGNLGKIFTTSYWGELEGGKGRGLYRPLTVLTFSAEYTIWRLKPLGYHLVNVALHALTTVLLFLMAIRVLESPVSAFIAASVFAVHPVHTEAVTGIVGRAEILTTLFCILAFLFSTGWAIPWRLPDRESRVIGSRTLLMVAAASLFYLLGLLSKETAITLPGVVLIYDLTRRERTHNGLDKKKAANQFKHGLLLSKYLGFSVVLVAYLALRSSIVASRDIWVGFAGVSASERILTASRVLMEYLALLVFPWRLLADYWKPDVPIARSLGEPLVLLSLLLWVALGFATVVLWRKSHPLFFSLAWFFITVLPVSNLLFAIGLGKAERILYLPSVGFCLFIGGVWGVLHKQIRKEWLLILPFFPVLFLFAVRTYNRNADWKNNLTLALASLKESPTSPLFNQIAASEFRKRGEPNQAIPLLQEAIRQRPEEYSYHYNLGNAYLDVKQYTQAIASYQKAIQLGPQSLDALNNLGQAQMQTGRNADAVKTFTTIISVNPRYLGAYLNLGTAYLNLGSLAEAARVFQEGLSQFPNHGGLHFNLGVVLNQMGQKQRAMQEHQKAIALDPSLRNFQ